MNIAKDSRRYCDRREYLIEAVRKRRKKLRQLAIEYKGSRCQVCGYDKCPEAMEFHHTDSSKKDFGISHKGYTRSWKKVELELDKCVMLCANCHREVHAGLQLPRETVVDKVGEFREIPPQRDNPEPSPRSFLAKARSGGRCRD